MQLFLPLGINRIALKPRATLRALTLARARHTPRRCVTGTFGRKRSKRGGFRDT
jgi:hypothetical protein